MSIEIMNRVWKQSLQKDSALLLTLALADNANDYGICWPSTIYLRDKIRMSKRQTITILDKLEIAAEIYVVRPESQGRGQTNQYIVLSGMTDEQIEDALDELGLTEKGATISSLKKKRVQFLQEKGAIFDLENLPDFSDIGKRESPKRKRTTVIGTVKEDQPSKKSDVTEEKPKHHMIYLDVSLGSFGFDHDQLKGQGKINGTIGAIVYGVKATNTAGLINIYFGYWGRDWDSIPPEKYEELSRGLKLAYAAHAKLRDKDGNPLHRLTDPTKLAAAAKDALRNAPKLDGIPRDAQGQPLPPSLPPRLPPVTLKEPEYDF